MSRGYRSNNFYRVPALYTMEQLGLTHLPEGDALDWEHRAFGWRSG